MADIKGETSGQGQTAAAGGSLLWIVPLATGIAWYTAVAVTQYLSNHSYYHDLGLQDYCVYNTLVGRFMLDLDQGANYFGNHLCPILLALIPLYALFDHPLVLSVSEAVLLAAACWPLFLLAESILEDRVLASLVSILYLCHNSVASTLLSQHFEAIEPFLAFFALYFALKARLWPYLAFLVALLAVKEDLCLYWFFFGLYLIARRERRTGLITCAVTIAWGAIGFGLVMPWIRGGAPTPHWFALWTPAGEGGIGTLSSILSSFGGALLKLPLNPFRGFVASTGFVSLLDPLGFLLVLPPSLILLAARTEAYNNFWYFYTIPAVPFLFLATINGFRFLTERVRFGAIWRRSALAALVLGLSLHSLLTPTLTHGWKMRTFDVTDHHRLLPGLIKRHIPPDASTAAQYDLFCHVPHREAIALLDETTIDRMEFVLLDLKGYAGPLSKGAYTNILTRLTSETGEGRELVARRDGYLVFRNTRPIEGMDP
ncbi:DUF2079 domain-containing protein [Thermodesulfobacteriota bacterium]